MADLESWRAIGCEGKERFDSYTLANRVLVARNRNRRLNRSPYHCQFCKGWHLGTNKPKNKAVPKFKAHPVTV